MCWGCAVPCTHGHGTPTRTGGGTAGTGVTTAHAARAPVVQAHYPEACASGLADEMAEAPLGSWVRSLLTLFAPPLIAASAIAIVVRSSSTFSPPSPPMTTRLPILHESHASGSGSRVSRHRRSPLTTSSLMSSPPPPTPHRRTPTPLAVIPSFSSPPPLPVAPPAQTGGARIRCRESGKGGVEKVRWSSVLYSRFDFSLSVAAGR